MFHVNAKAILALLVAGGVVAIVLAIPYLLTNHIPSFVHLWKLGIFWSVAKYLLSFVGVWFTYILGKSFIEVSRVGDSWQSELKHYLIGIGVCGLLALVSAYYLGTHTEGADPMFGGGEVVVDYKPTDGQRIRHGLIFFFCLCIPALYGINNALQELRYKRGQTSTLSNKRSG